MVMGIYFVSYYAEVSFYNEENMYNSYIVAVYIQQISITVLILYFIFNSLIRNIHIFKAIIRKAKVVWSSVVNQEHRGQHNGGEGIEPFDREITSEDNSYPPLLMGRSQKPTY